MKKTIILKLLCVIVLFGGCSRIEGTDIKITPENQHAYEVITTIYSDEELQQIYESEFETIAELNNVYPIECVRYHYDESSEAMYEALADMHTEIAGEEITRESWAPLEGYDVYYLGESSVIHIMFSMNGSYWKTFYPINIATSSEAFSHIEIGDTYEDVYAVDPDGWYPFVNMPNNAAGCSLHFTSDGYRIMYEFDSVPGYAVGSEASYVYQIVDMEKTWY